MGMTDEEVAEMRQRNEERAARLPEDWRISCNTNALADPVRTILDIEALIAENDRLKRIRYEICRWW